MIFIPGLVSVTFRQLSPEDIVSLCREARLLLIEWGGDVHVPHGDLEAARRARDLTESEGLRMACYGSYYRVGEPPGTGPEFDAVLDTALDLGVPGIRVWAGRKGSADSTDEDWRRVLDDALRIADQAAEYGVNIAFEYHARTLADARSAVRRLTWGLTRPNIFMLWQPAPTYDPAERLPSLNDVLSRLLYLHVYHWSEDRQRLPLAEGAEPWSGYLQALAYEGVPRALLLEFVRDQDPDQFRRDALTLRTWIAEAERRAAELH